jgi:hypothetical protein
MFLKIFSVFDIIMSVFIVDEARLILILTVGDPYGPLL